MLDRSLQIGKVAVCIAAVVALLAAAMAFGCGAWALRELGKETIARKAETHAIAAVTKTEAHETAEVVRERVKHEDLAAMLLPYANAATSIGQTAAALKKRIDSQDVTDIIDNAKDATQNVGDLADAVQSRVDSDDVDGIFANLTVASRSTIDLITEARGATRESVTTQKAFQANSADFGRMLKPMGLFVSDLQFKEHEIIFGVGCAVDKQNCPKPKISNWKKAYRIVRGVTSQGQPAYYLLKLYNGQ